MSDYRAPITDSVRCPSLIPLPRVAHAQPDTVSARLSPAVNHVTDHVIEHRLTDRYEVWPLPMQVL